MSIPRTVFQEEHEAFRQTVRRFVDREIVPYVDLWDEAEEFPRELYRKASAAGLMQMGFPEEYGGSGLGLAEASVIMEEINFSGGNSFWNFSRSFVVSIGFISSHPHL